MECHNFCVFPVFHVSMRWQYFIRHPGVLFMGSGVFPLFLEFLPGGLTIDIQTGQWINMVNVTSDCCTHPCSSPSLSFFLNTTASVGGAATYTREHFEHGRGRVFCTKLCDSCHICQTQSHNTIWPDSRRDQWLKFIYKDRVIPSTPHPEFACVVHISPMTACLHQFITSGYRIC